MRRLFVLILLGSLGFVAGCGGSSNSASTSSSPSTPPSSSSANVLPIAVDGGPAADKLSGEIYVNGAFATATICAPGSSSCVTVDHLLVDTGSSGLRVLQSAIGSLSLPSVNATSGSAAYNCVSFVDGSFLWGPVEAADVTLGGETASRLPVQVISEAATGIPSSCSNGSTDNENTEALLGANGILGVGSEPTDCFYNGASICDPASGAPNPPTQAYYTCSGSVCNPAFIVRANQVANPVVLFPTDNNGVIVELGAVSGSAATVSGSLIFGIGTETNNQLPSSATVFTLSCDDFTTNFENQSLGITNAANCTGPGSFIDSGSNGLFFPDLAQLPTCPKNTPAGDLSSFYCPSSLENFSATNAGANGASKASSFSVDNAETLFTSASTASDAAMATLAGENPSGVGFDWGLPFFYGVNVYTSIDGQNMPSGAPTAPWWAY